MRDLLKRIAVCVERGKVDAASPHPPDMRGQEGADELTRRALDGSVPPRGVLIDGLVAGMEVVGRQFRDGQIFLPDVLMAARAMHAAMAHLKPYFQSGEVERKGTVVIGTVAGDLHDIGKKIVGMFLEGAGWNVVDLGVDVDAERYAAAIEESRPRAVGLSALLTTTMESMTLITKEIKTRYPGVTVIVGGAPVTRVFADRIGADAYFPEPQGALDFLNSIAD